MSLNELKRRGRENYGAGTYLSRKWVRAVLWMRSRPTPIWILEGGPARFHSTGR